MKKILTIHTVFVISILAALALLIIPSFSPTIRATGDGFAHKFRTVSFIKSIQEGTIRPRWLPDPALGYGTPVFIYNYSFPYYVVAGMTAFTHAVERSSQLYGAIVLLATFISMYLFARKLYGWKIGLLTALAYVGTPTILYCVYGLEGWGQMTAFIFPPIICYEVLLLQESATVRRSLIFVATWFIFINTHNVSAMIAVIPITCMMVFLVKKKIRRLLFIAQLFLAAVVISAFFWLPALTLSPWIKFNDLVLYHASTRQYEFLTLYDYITTSVQTLTTGVTSIISDTPGLLIFMILISSSIVFLTIWFRKLLLHKNNTDRTVSYAIALFLMTIIALIMTTNLSIPIWKTGLFDSLLQYPSRLLFVVPFTAISLFGWLLKKIANTWVYLLLCAVIFILAHPFTHPVFNYDFDIHYFENNVQLTDWAIGTRMSMGTVEFLPKWMNVDFIKQQEDTYGQTGKLPEKLELNPTVGTLLDQQILSEHMQFHLRMDTATDVVINTAYYPNWQATVNEYATPVNHDAYGRISVHVPKGDVMVSLQFGYSVIEKWSYVVSLLGIVYLFLLLRKLHQ